MRRLHAALLLATALAGGTLVAWMARGERFEALGLGGEPKPAANVRRSPPREPAPDPAARAQSSPAPPSPATSSPVPPARAVELGRDARSELPRPPTGEAPTALARVLVIDDAGRTVAGIPVGLYDDADCSWIRLPPTTTGADGMALLSMTPTELAWRREESDRWWVAVAAPLANRERVELDLAAQPLAPIRLAIGAFGSLSVRFDAGGRELGALRVRVEPVLPESDWLIEDAEPPALDLQLDGLELELSCLEPGLDWFLSIAGPVRDGLLVHGPERAGEHVEVTHVLARATRYRMRLVEEAGAPIRDSNVRALFAERGETLLVRDGVTGSDGALEVEGPDAWTRASARSMELVVGTPDGALVGRRTLPEATDDETVELGELVLAPPPLVVAGRVVDDRGGPVAEVDVDVLLAAEATSRYPDRLVSAHCGEGGRFELRGLTPDLPLALRADAVGWLPSPPARFELGASDVELVLEPAGAIHGWVMYDEGLSREALVVDLVDIEPADAETSPSRPWRERKAWEDGFSFTFSELPPGRASVRVALRGEQEPLALVRGVEVRGGETSYDERLQGIDLTGLLHPLVVEVVDARGFAVPDGWIELRAHGAEGWPRRVDFDDGRVELLERHPAVDLRVGAPGMRTALVEAVSRAARVELAPGLALRLELDESIVLGVRDEDWLELWLCPLEHVGVPLDELPDDVPHVLLERERAAAILAPAPGEHRARWRYAWLEDELRDASGPIVVRDVEGGQRSTVRPDGEALAEARRRADEDG